MKRATSEWARRQVIARRNGSGGLPSDPHVIFSGAPGMVASGGFSADSG
ncbi:hypothetical protein [Streptomyces sp. NBC_01236]|nr:hypothetical protein OG324_32355 [Streptomyces sp. NBC_01236]